MNRKRVLLVAFHMPPIQGSSGVHRTLAFSRYLQDYGWDVSVLTAVASAYFRSREENLNLIAPHVRVVRGWGLNTWKHLAIKGRYPRILAVPDQWQSWILGGAISGLREIRRWRPDVLMSTYPLASAHAIGLILKKASGLPWIADFRDPMAQPNHPTDPLVRKSYEWIERRVFESAARITVTTTGAAETYRLKYEGYDRNRIRVIENGYDEGIFPTEPAPAVRSTAEPHRVVLLHSGLLYGAERNPEHFFSAVAELRDEGAISGSKVEIRLRAPGDLQVFNAMVRQSGVEDIVTVCQPIDYQAALEEMLSVDGLVIFQASICNAQIPAKAYEYLYAGRPIMALTDPAGNTAGLLQKNGVHSIYRLDDKADIKRGIVEFLSALSSGTVHVPSRDQVSHLSRRARTVELARLLDELV